MSNSQGDPVETGTHTPGPWRWEISLKSKQVSLNGGKPKFDLTVMDFVRWGMGGAAPRLLRPMASSSMMLMEHCQRYAVPVPGREHHADWFRELDHPDARLIAAAPDLLAALKLLHDNLAEYQQLNHLGGYDNHDMQMARAAISKAEGPRGDR